MNELSTFEQSSGNVYADLGLAEPEELLAKAKLVRAIGKIVAGRGWTDREAADTLVLDQTTFTAMLRGQFADLSTDKLIRYLNALDYDVTIAVGPKEVSQERAKVTVLVEGSDSALTPA